MKPLWHHLSLEEREFAEHVLDHLRPISWASPLVKAIDAQGGVRAPENRPLLFEARVCFEIDRAGIVPRYEVSAGIGESTIDLLIPGEPNWLVELVAAEESDILELATYEEVLTDENGESLGTKARFLELRGDADDQRLSEAGEMIKLQEKLYEKVCKDGRPHKFPIPTEDTRHAILVDARGFGGGDGPDAEQIMQLMYGPKYVPAEYVQTFARNPVAGLFDVENTRKGAHLLRERIHIIGFCMEEEFGHGTLQKRIAWRPNHLLWENEKIFDQAPSFFKHPVASANA
jgi:hypothetical protein